MGILKQEYCSGLPCPPPGGLPNPRNEPRSPALQAECLPAELPGKPKNSGGSSLFLPQGIFPTQKLNLGLLHCRRFFTSWATKFLWYKNLSILISTIF